MSEPSASADDVQPPPAEEQNIEHQLQPKGQAVGQRPAAEERATESPPSTQGGPPEGVGTPAGAGADEAAEDKTAEDETADRDKIEAEIRQLETETETARQQKVRAESDFADRQNRLGVLREVQKGAVDALKAYQAAFDQLVREDKAYEEYLTFERESLRKRLGDPGVERVEQLSQESTAEGERLQQEAATAAETLRQAEAARDELKTEVKKRGDVLNEWKKLTATVTARHAVLKAMRDEVTKARHAGRYGLAYWLLERARKTQTSFAADPRLKKPDEVPEALLGAVKALADAEQKHAEAERTVTDAKETLAAATKARDKHEANAEAELRDDLQQIQGIEAVTTGEPNHA